MNIISAVNQFFVPLSFFLKKNCEILYFKIPADVLIAYLDYDIIKTVDQRIKLAETLDLNRVPNSHEEKKILKLGWLIKDIVNNGVKNPIQLIKSGEKYFCHPGSDRILVTSYIHPIEITGFYLWYRDLDKEPFILDYETVEIKNFLQFIKLFYKSKTLKFYSAKIHNSLDTSDSDDLESKAVFDTAKTCFQKSKNNFNYNFITYQDKMQWIETKKLKLNDVIMFINDTECVYGGVRFLKKNNYWIVNND
jgi:hypothetical protein